MTDIKGKLSTNVWSIFKKTEEGNGNPLKYSCLENSMDGGAEELMLLNHVVGEDS